MNGEVPIAGLADEILTPGKGQVRGLLVFAGNPVMSAPGGTRLDEALSDLEFMVSVDQYVNETNRHADVILPPVSALERDEVDVALPLVAIRNHIRFSPAAVPKREGGKEDWEILNGITKRLGRGIATKARAFSLGARLASPARVVESAIAAGPYGILRRGPRKGLTLRTGEAREARRRPGADEAEAPRRAPLARQARRAGAARTARRRRASSRRSPPSARQREREGFDLTLIGRRILNSNNSWMHNSKRLTKGSDRCTAMLNPEDAAARSLEDGSSVKVVSRVGEIEVLLQVTDELRPGVVSVPHGFGHGSRKGVGWKHAASLPGASVNDITDPSVLDGLTGNAAFNSVPVRLEAA